MGGVSVSEMEGMVEGWKLGHGNRSGEASIAIMSAVHPGAICVCGIFFILSLLYFSLRTIEVEGDGIDSDGVGLWDLNSER